MTGARIVGCTHINAQTAVLIETLVALGAQVCVNLEKYKIALVDTSTKRTPNNIYASLHYLIW